jgi:ribosome-associated protein
MQTIDTIKQTVIQELEDLKGENIVALDISQLCDFTDTMIICSGRSSRHVKSLGQRVAEKMKHQQQPALGIEGEDTGDWVLIDLGVIVVHIFQPEIREFYNLEQLWNIQPE